MDFYEELKKASHDLGDNIVGLLYERGLLSENAVAMLALLHNDIAEAISDWISDCKSDEAEARSERLADES